MRRVRTSLFRQGRECIRNSPGLKEMQADLVFRGAHQECAHNSKEISCFHADLVFRDIPGKSVQRGRHTQRLRRLLL